MEEGIENTDCEDKEERRLTHDLKRSKLRCSVEQQCESYFHKVAALGKNLSE